MIKSSLLLFGNEFLPPVVSQATVSTDLLEPLQILTQFVVKGISNNLGEQYMVK